MFDNVNFSFEELIDLLIGATKLIMIVGVFGIAIGGIVALIVADPYLGSIFHGMYIGDEWIGLFLSFAGTGLLIGGVGLFKHFIEEDNWTLWQMAVAALVVILFLIDIYFDSLSVDILKYGEVIGVSSLPVNYQVPHWLLRVFAGALSTVGEVLAIFIFPVMQFMGSIMRNAMEEI